MAAPERVVELSQQVGLVARNKIGEIDNITRGVKMLALNAMIEAARAGENGRGFAVVAGEIKNVSNQISKIAEDLSKDLARTSEELTAIGADMVKSLRGQRLADLSFSIIDIVDRNLYERSCDVRWWATDAAVVGVLAEPSQRSQSYAADRLGVILGAYTVYIDLWIVDLAGRIVASGKQGAYAVAGLDVSNEGWFRKAAALTTGDAYVAEEVREERHLGGAKVATFAASIREGGTAAGKPIGVLCAHFDWTPQSNAALAAARLLPAERNGTRVLLADSTGRVIASSDGAGVFTETVPVGRFTDKQGYFEIDANATLGYALTPGFETYPGLGWFGVVIQKAAKQPDAPAARQNSQAVKQGAGQKAA